MLVSSFIPLIVGGFQGNWSSIIPKTNMPTHFAGLVVRSPAHTGATTASLPHTSWAPLSPAPPQCSWQGWLAEQGTPPHPAGASPAGPRRHPAGAYVSSFFLSSCPLCWALCWG